MTALRTAELEEIVRSSSLPVIIKGVLSVQDAERCLGAGAQGLVLSHHNNRISYAMPPMALLPGDRGDGPGQRADLCGL